MLSFAAIVTILSLLRSAANVGAVLTAALQHTCVSTVAYTRDGKIVYANRRFFEHYGCSEKTTKHLNDCIGPELWSIWEHETAIVLHSNSPLRYISQIGRTESGMWISSRSPSWGAPVTEQCTMFTELVPASTRRGIATRVRVPLTEVLRYIPAEFEQDHSTTITAKVLPIPQP